MRPLLRGALRSWWPLLLLMALAPLAAHWVPAFHALGAADEQRSGPWTTRRLALTESNGAVRATPVTPRPGIASRPLALDPAARFFRVQLCSRAAPGAERELLLMSLREGRLQRDRQYRLYNLNGDAAPRCVADALPRLRGDDAGAPNALLQLQVSGGEVVIEELTLQPLTENPAWRALRRGALGLGLVLLVYAFLGGMARSARGSRMQLAAGLAVVVGIVFGCCISVGLKAEIFALLTGAAEGPAVPMEVLLQTTYVAGGFPIFTVAHALLFATAALLLVPLARRAWLDLALLALVTETLQRFVPGRGPGIADVLVDWSGLLLAALLLAAFAIARRHGLFTQHQRVGEDVSGLGE